MGMKVIAVVTPAKAGVHLGKMDSRFRGNDATFDGEAKNLGSCRFNELRRSFLPFTLDRLRLS
jgi:hypothetical protein